MPFRKFVPEKLTIESLGKATILYGNDTYGIGERIARMKDVVENEGNVLSFNTASSAIDFLSSGDIFGNECAAIINAHDAMQTTQNSAKARKALLNALSETPVDRVIIYFPGTLPSTVLRELSEFCTRHGYLVPRKVDLGSNEMMTWAKDLCSQESISLDDSTIETVVRACDNDITMTRDVIMSLREQLGGMSENDIKNSIGATSKTRMYNLTMQILDRQSERLLEYYKSFENVSSGDAMFIKSLKSDVLDAMILLSDKSSGNADYISYKKRHYPNYNGSFAARNFRALSGKTDIRKLHAIFDVLSRAELAYYGIRESLGDSYIRDMVVEACSI